MNDLKTIKLQRELKAKLSEIKSSTLPRSEKRNLTRLAWADYESNFNSLKAS